jgi:D-alanine-D-alanine ligase
MRFREQLNELDPQAVHDLVAATGFFTPDEIDIATELAEAAFKEGPDSGYCFLLLESEGRLAGYACYGPIPGADGSYDLYWIAVDPTTQGKGLGKKLLCEAEERIRKEGGRRVYIETSSRDQYVPTRSFYLRCGYLEEAVLKDFYRSGDSKVIYSKVLG